MSVSFHTHRAPLLHSPAFGLWPRVPEASLAHWLVASRVEGKGAEASPWHCGARALQPCPGHTHTPGMGTLSIPPPPHTHMCTAKCWFTSILGSCCVARYGGPLVGETNGWLNKSNRQTTTSPILDVCLQALKALLLLSAQAAHVTLTKLAHCFRDSQLTNQKKISLQP